jgi:hypothetical protein
MIVGPMTVLGPTNTRPPPWQILLSTDTDLPTPSMLSLLQLAGPPPSSAVILRSGGAGAALAPAFALTGAKTESPAMAATTAARRFRLGIMLLLLF